MGRLLESLKRPHSAFAPPQPAAENAVAAPPKPAAEPAARTAADETNEEIPFFEIPEAPAMRRMESPVLPAVVVKVNGAAPHRAVSLHPSPPITPPFADCIAPELVVWREPAGPAAAQYLQVADELRQMLAASRSQSLLLMPLDNDANQTAAALNLSLALANGDQKVLFIDADAWTQSAASYFGLATAPGWTDVVQGLPCSQAAQDTGWHSLHLMAAGNRLAASTSPLLGAKMRSILQRLQTQYDLIILNGPAWAVNGMAAVAVHLCDAVCLLLDTKQVQQPAETRLLESLRQERVRVLGSVITTCGM